MASFFTLLNAYQDQIIACVTIALGGLQISVSSWAIHRLVLDEHFLMFVIGDMMRPLQVKNMWEKYSSAQRYLKSSTGLFETLIFTKTAFSLALVCGVIQILVSFLMLCVKSKYKIIRITWVSLSVVSACLLAASFVMLWLYWVPNVLYFQISLSFCGVNFFLMVHLIASIAPSIILETCFRKKDKDTTEDEETKGEEEIKEVKGNDTSSTPKTDFPKSSTPTMNLQTDALSIRVEMTPKTAQPVKNESNSDKRSKSKIFLSDISLPLPPPPPSPTV